MFGIRAGDLRRFADLATPSFFEVVPMRSLWTQGRELLASTKDEAAFERLLRRVDAVLSEADVPLRARPVADAPASSPSPSDPEQARRRGELVLRLYFAQLGRTDQTALDLRQARFHPSDDTADPRLLWAPRPLSVTWDPEFLAGIRGLYHGFYRDDDEQFERSAAALGLSAATDLFRQQFGEGDQTQVRFDLDRFKESFHEIFVRCREHGASLHPNFVALGVYLGGLYEHLDALAVPLDARGAFEAVWPRAATH